MAEMEIDQDDRPQCERRISFMNPITSSSSQPRSHSSTAVNPLSLATTPCQFFTQATSASYTPASSRCYYQSGIICSQVTTHTHRNVYNYNYFHKLIGLLRASQLALGPLALICITKLNRSRTFENIIYRISILDYPIESLIAFQSDYF